MKQLLLAFALCLCCLYQVSRADDPPAAARALAPAAVKTGPTVQLRVTTNFGVFVIELNAERAPLSVANFLKYVDQGHYTNSLFHRVVPNFVIQGGGFDTQYAPIAAPNRVVNESGNGLSNLRGTVGMARGNDPHSADAQFFVNLSDNAALDPNQTRWGYAVMGKVISGMEVVDRMANVATGKHEPIKEDTPLKPVIIQKIERIAP